MPGFDSAVALSLSGHEPLAALLAAGEPPAGLWRPDEMAAIFEHQMAAPLVVDLRGLAPPVARRLEALAGGQGAPAQSFADLLRQQNPPLELLELVKDFAKANLDHPESGLPSEIASALYYTSIASALVHRDKRITSLSDTDLQRGLSLTRDQAWLDDATKALLTQALEKISASQKGTKP